MTLPFPEPPPTSEKEKMSTSSSNPKRLSILAEAHDLPPPFLDLRWVHGGAQHLDLLATPITTVGTTYVPFSEKENRRLEMAFQKLSEEEKVNVGKISGRAREEAEKRKKAEEKEGGGKGQSGGDKSSIKGEVNNGAGLGAGSKLKSVVGQQKLGGNAMVKTASQEAEDKGRPPVAVSSLEKVGSSLGTTPLSTSATTETYPDPSDHPHSHSHHQTSASTSSLSSSSVDSLISPNSTTNIPVSQDGLFSVSLLDMSLFPVFWAHSGGRIPVLRGTWFMSGTGSGSVAGGGGPQACEWELAEELERGYQSIQPWQTSYPPELQKAIEQGGGAEEKLKHKLPEKFGSGVSVVYRDEKEGEIVATGMTSYLAKLFWTSIRSKPGTQVYRGYQAALDANKPKERDTPSRSRRPSENSRSRRASVVAEREKDKGKASRDGSVSSIRSRKESMGRTSVEIEEHLKKYAREGETGRTLGQIPAPNDKDVHAESSLSGTTTESGLPPGPKSHHSRLTDRLAEVSQKVGSRVEDTMSKMERVAFLNGSAVDDDDTDGPGHARTEEQVPVTSEEEDEEVCTDLILVIHGIGQQLATQYESFNFVYATNTLRSVMKTQSTNPALASIIRSRRTQVLPIQWRANLELEEENNEEAITHGMDNRFTMADITLSKIPAIRQITNSVLLDIPLFMSHHRQRMIEAVCMRANRAYRMWCERNPGFDGVGKVHVIGHSLGSALAAHILSNQPTRMPHMSQLPRQILSQTKNQFLFNTSNVFLCGSPLGIFLHLDQAQIMPRKGRERTMNSPQDEALDRAGRFGCMSCDTIYNIIHVSDPVAYALNATVDSKLARSRPPLPITSVTAPFFSSVTDPLVGLTKYLDNVSLSMPSLPGWRSSSTGNGGGEGKGTGDKRGGNVKKPSILRLPSGIEMSGPEGEERLIGSRAERRFNALNPHGNIDFVLPSGGVSEYLDAITAHQNYWGDANFASFLLAEIYSTKLDVLRTGMGLAQRDGHLPEDIAL